MCPVARPLAECPAPAPASAPPHASRPADPLPPIHQGRRGGGSSTCWLAGGRGGVTALTRAPSGQDAGCKPVRAHPPQPATANRVTRTIISRKCDLGQRTLLQDELAVRGEEENGEGAMNHAPLNVLVQVGCTSTGNMQWSNTADAEGATGADIHSVLLSWPMT